MRVMLKFVAPCALIALASGMVSYWVPKYDISKGNTERFVPRSLSFTRSVAIGHRERNLLFDPVLVYSMFLGEDRCSSLKAFG
jgi:hypothetical protein